MAGRLDISWRSCLRPRPILCIALLLQLCPSGRLVSQDVSSVLEFQYGVYGPSRGVIFRNPQGIAYERHRQEIYVADTGNRNVSIFDSNGRHLFSFTYRVKTPSGADVLAEPRSVAVDRDGFIYLTDAVSEAIQVRDPRGQSVARIDLCEVLGTIGKKVIPEHLFIDSRGDLYVTTGGDVRELIVLDRNHKPVRRISGTDKGYGALSGVWVDEQGRIYLTDALNTPCVQVYDPDGAYRFGFGEKEIGDENFSLPHGIATTANGDIWVVDSIRQVVKRFDKEGRFLDMLGGFGINAGDLLYPMGVAGDGAGRLFVLERVGSRYQSFRVKETEGVPN